MREEDSGMFLLCGSSLSRNTDSTDLGVLRASRPFLIRLPINAFEERRGPLPDRQAPG